MVNLLDENIAILKFLKVYLMPADRQAVNYILNYAEMTRSLMYNAVVFRNESSQALSSIKCKACEEVYWVNCGDLSDITAYEPDAYRCPHCQSVDIITDKIMQEIQPVDPDDAEDGFKTPNEAIGL